MIPFIIKYPKIFNFYSVLVMSSKEKGNSLSQHNCKMTETSEKEKLTVKQTVA
jgi:hypothetical protein